MFGIGLGELIVLAAIGVIVLGPHRLVRAATSLGAAFGRLKQEWSDVREDFTTEEKEEGYGDDRGQ